MKIAVFLHGTAIMHSHAAGLPRKEKAKQVVENEPSIFDFINYIPVDGAVQKLKSWESQGAEIIYLSSHENIEGIKKDKIVLKRYDFPKGRVYWRKDGESYAKMVEKIMPDILVEDDCKSIGGETEMCYPKIKSELKQKIKHIIVKEFQGIDHLPDNLQDLVLI